MWVPAETTRPTSWLEKVALEVMHFHGRRGGQDGQGESGGSGGSGGSGCGYAGAECAVVASSESGSLMVGIGGGDENEDADEDEDGLMDQQAPAQAPALVTITFCSAALSPSLGGDGSSCSNSDPLDTDNADNADDAGIRRRIPFPVTVLASKQGQQKHRRVQTAGGGDVQSTSSSSSSSSSSSRSCYLAFPSPGKHVAFPGHLRFRFPAQLAARLAHFKAAATTANPTTTTTTNATTTTTTTTTTNATTTTTSVTSATLVEPDPVAPSCSGVQGLTTMTGSHSQWPSSYHHGHPPLAVVVKLWREEPRHCRDTERGVDAGGASPNHVLSNATGGQSARRRGRKRKGSGGGGREGDGRGGARREGVGEGAERACARGGGREALCEIQPKWTGGTGETGKTDGARGEGWDVREQREKEETGERRVTTAMTTTGRSSAKPTKPREWSRPWGGASPPVPLHTLAAAMKRGWSDFVVVPDEP
jgi:hypothetical protein